MTLEVFGAELPEEPPTEEELAEAVGIVTAYVAMRRRPFASVATPPESPELLVLCGRDVDLPALAKDGLEHLAALRASLANEGVEA